MLKTRAYKVVGALGTGGRYRVLSLEQEELEAGQIAGDLDLWGTSCRSCRRLSAYSSPGTCSSASRRQQALVGRRRTAPGLCARP